MIGLFTPKEKVFIALSPVCLLISMLLVLYNKREKKSPEKYFFVVGIIATVVMSLECAITNVPTLYKQFIYTDVLGMFLFMTPLVIFIPWMLHVICIASVLEKTVSNIFAKSAISSSLAVILHAMYSHAATQLGFWTVKKGHIPYQELIISALIYFFLFGIYYSFDFRKKNKIAWVFIIMEILFFGVVLLFL
jgi:putative membrane protein